MSMPRSLLSPPLKPWKRGARASCLRDGQKPILNGCVISSLGVSHVNYGGVTAFLHGMAQMAHPSLSLMRRQRKKQQTRIMARLSALSKMKMFLIPGSQAPYGHFQRLAGQKIPLSSNAIILVMCLSQALTLSFSGLLV